MAAGRAELSSTAHEHLDVFPPVPLRRQSGAVFMIDGEITAGALGAFDDCYTRTLFRRH